VRLSGSPGALALSPDGKRIYAAVRSEKKFATLAIDPATGLLSIVATAAAAGNPAYVHPDATGRWLLAAYYGEGLVSVSPINKEGIIVEEPIQVLDIGPKAHCIRTDPTNRFAFTPHPMDLNCVDQFRFDAAKGELALNDPPTMPGDENAGPRHLKFHANGKWAYVVNEQGKSVTFCYYDAGKGTLTKQQTLSTHPKEWDANSGSCAEIKISEDGRFVYASNRGHESIASFTIDPQSGKLAELERVPTEKIPRSFDLMPGGRFVVVAGQGEGKLALYRRDPETGLLKRAQTLECGKSPAWVMGLRLP
jgi:6-phosphogluconolactonase